MDSNGRTRNTFRNSSSSSQQQQQQQSLKQRLHHPHQSAVYSSGDSDLENEAHSQVLRLTAYGDCDREIDDSPEDHIYNQYEKIIDSRTSASSSTLSSNHPGIRSNVDTRGTHYAESAIYKRSRGKETVSFLN